MKKTLIAISAACVGALSVLAGDAATSYAGLKLGTNDWFSVTADGSVVTGGGLDVGSDNKFTSTGFEATDPAHPITFTSTNATADVTLRTVTIVTKASTVPSGMDMDVSDKIAVSLREVGSATNFYAKIGAGWVLLTGGAVPEENSSYALVIRFDDRNGGKKVQFATIIDSTESVLTGTGATTDRWFDYSALTDIRSEQVHVGLLGKGLRTDFDGVVLNILAEVVPAGDGGAIEINEEDKAVFEEVVKASSGKYESVSAYLQASVRTAVAATATRAAPDVTVAQAYALGLIVTENNEVKAVNDGALEAKAGAIVTDGIKVGFIGITPHPETVESIEYVLLGSADGTTWDTDPIATFESADAIKIPTSALSSKHFFKVNAKVTLKDNPQ